MVVTTINTVLLNQLKEKARLLQATYIKFVLAINLSTYLGGDYVILFDEYHWALTTTMFEQNYLRVLPPVFSVGLNERMNIFTGHHSSHFEGFCRKHFDSFSE